MATETTPRRRTWLLSVLFGVLTLLLGAYLLASYVTGRPFELDIFVYFCLNALGLAHTVYLLLRRPRHANRAL